MILSFEETVIKKRKAALKEETELDNIKAKRYLDFLDILLLARVCNEMSIQSSDFRKLDILAQTLVTNKKLYYRTPTVKTKSYNVLYR